MTQLTIHVPENKLGFIKRLIEELHISIVAEKQTSAKKSTPKPELDETGYLLSSAANVASLKKSMQEAKKVKLKPLR
ncbi:MAG: hypothetical protein EBX41_09835 [Chitinophagia bacterium]|nr:hypothetical protein [Chitinophagia bacterium]